MGNRTAIVSAMETEKLIDQMAKGISNPAEDAVALNEISTPDNSVSEALEEYSTAADMLDRLKDLHREGSYLIAHEGMTHREIDIFTGIANTYASRVGLEMPAHALSTENDENDPDKRLRLAVEGLGETIDKLASGVKKGLSRAAEKLSDAWTSFKIASGKICTVSINNAARSDRIWGNVKKEHDIRDVIYAYNKDYLKSDATKDELLRLIGSMRNIDYLEKDGTASASTKPLLTDIRYISELVYEMIEKISITEKLIAKGSPVENSEIEKILTLKSLSNFPIMTNKHIIGIIRPIEDAEVRTVGGSCDVFYYKVKMNKKGNPGISAKVQGISLGYIGMLKSEPVKNLGGMTAPTKSIVGLYHVELPKLESASEKFSKLIKSKEAKFDKSLAHLVSEVLAMEEFVKTIFQSFGSGTAYMARARYALSHWYAKGEVTDIEEQ